MKNAVSRISCVCALSLFSVNLSLKRHARHYFQTIVLFRETLRTNKHLHLKCEEHFNGVRNNFALLAAGLTKMTKEKQSQNVVKRYLDLSLNFVCCFSDLFFHQLIINVMYPSWSCHKRKSISSSRCKALHLVKNDGLPNKRLKVWGFNLSKLKKKKKLSRT